MLAIVELADPTLTTLLHQHGVSHGKVRGAVVKVVASAIIVRQHFLSGRGLLDGIGVALLIRAARPPVFVLDA